MCLEIAAWMSFFCLPEGRSLGGRGGADPAWLQSWYRTCLSAGWVTSQETSSWTWFSSQVIFGGLGVEDLEDVAGNGPVASWALPFPFPRAPVLPAGLGIGWALPEGLADALPFAFWVVLDIPRDWERVQRHAEHRRHWGGMFFQTPTRSLPWLAKSASNQSHPENRLNATIATVPGGTDMLM